MSVQVTVALVDDELVAVKRATTPAASARLRVEAARLAQAVHPGVVTLVGSHQVEGGDELRLGYAGESLEGWRGTLPQLAGLVAAVAATVADLHDLGIVHGRIDAGHVLVGPDGRPRLCSLSGPGDATAADDVLAVGRLLDGLADQAVDPRRPRRRQGGAERRALARVVARATDADPRRRPSARTLSTSILAAVPAARLSPATGSSPAPTRAPHLHELWDTLALSRRATDDARVPTPDPAGAAAAPAPPADARRPPAAPARGRGATHDLAACAPASPPAGADPLGPTDPDDPWAWARGGGPEAASGAHEAEAEPRAGVEGEGEGESALDAWLAWSAAAGLERPQPRPDGGADGPGRSQRAPAGDRPGRRGPGPLPRLGDARRPSGPDGPDGGAGPVPVPGGAPAAGDRETPGVPRGDGLDPGACGDDRRAPSGAGATELLGVGPQEGTWLDDARLGPGRREPPRPGRPRPGRRRVAGVTAAGVVGAGLVAAGLLASPGGVTPGVDVAEPQRRPAGDCPAAPAPAADVDGDGCAEALVVDGNRVSAGDATWELGRPGDVVAVGDWDCDGSASSALLRPATGDVFVFSGWSSSGEPVTVAPTRSVPGGTDLRVDEAAGGCDSLVVEVAGGRETVVAEARA